MKMDRSVRLGAALAGRWRAIGRGVAAGAALGAAVLACGTAAAATPGEGLDLEALKGKVVYVDFWASWCGPCQASFPYMNDLDDRYSDKDLVVIAVNVDKDREKAEAFLKKVGAHVPVIFDPAGDLPEQFHVKTMPTSFLIDRSGAIRFTHDGFKSDSIPVYDSHIVELVHEK